MKLKLTFLILLFAQICVYGQTKVVINNKNEPIPFVNIGIAGRTMGTVSKIDGKFELSIPETIKNTSITFSSVGYQTIVIPVDKFRTQSTFIMKTDTTAIQEVEVNVSKKKLKEKIIGNTTDAKNVTFTFSSGQPGNELGTLMKIRKSPTYIQNVNINIAHNQRDSVHFRLNIYKTDKDKQPSTKLLQKNVIVTSFIKSGTITVDLEKYNLVADDDVVVTMELLEPWTDDLHFSAGLLGSSIFIRGVSQASWERVKGFNIGMYMTVLQ